MNYNEIKNFQKKTKKIKMEEEQCFHERFQYQSKLGEGTFESCSFEKSNS